METNRTVRRCLLKAACVGLLIVVTQFTLGNLYETPLLEVKRDIMLHQLDDSNTPRQTIRLVRASEELAYSVSYGLLGILGTLLFFDEVRRFTRS